MELDCIDDNPLGAEGALVPEDFLAGMPDPASVRTLEAEMLQHAAQVDLHTQHLVHAGMYARTIFIPAGTLLTGAQTEVDNVCIVVGDITVTTDDGTRRLTGYYVIPANAGFKRAGIAHADTWWTTLFRTDNTEIAAIEDEVTREADRLQSRRLLENKEH